MILPMAIRSVFMGSPSFAVPTMLALAEISELAGIVTQPNRPSGRGRTLTPPPIKEAADRQHIPAIQPEKLSLPDAMAVLEGWHPDIIIVAAFGQILRKSVLQLPPFGCLNLHASLLPRHRGAAPIAAAILSGDSETGITLMQMDPGLDTGPILGSRAISIDSLDTAASLSEKLSLLAASTLKELLPHYLRGDLSPHPQDRSLATYAPQLSKEDGKLDIRQSAVRLERQIRAYFPWPGSFLQWNGVMLKVLAGEAKTGSTSNEIGLLFEDGGFPAIQCGEGILILRLVHPAGKKPMSGKDFLRGMPGVIGSLVP
jgi:methionyl-tRNA formyltransferase